MMGDVSEYIGLEGIADDLDLHPFNVNVGCSSRRFPSCPPSAPNAVPQSSGMRDLFFPRLDQFHVPETVSGVATQMTDLTNSLPRNDCTTASLSAQAILAKLDCSDLSSSLNPSLNQSVPDDRHRELDADLFGAVYNQYDAAPTHSAKPLEPTDVYGRVTCYDGKIVLQLRLLNLNTNFPINVSECWLCRNKVHGGSQLYAHKHKFQGIFQVSDEYVHIIIPEPEPLLDKSVFHTNFGGSQSTDFTTKIASTSDLDFREDPGDPNDSFSLPYMAHAFGIDDTILDGRHNACTMQSSSSKSCSTYPHNGPSSGHNIHTAVDNIYSICNTTGVSNIKGISYNHSINEVGKLSENGLHSLDSHSRDPCSPVKLPQTRTAVPSQKRTEIGAKKRKSKAQKKASVIRMKEDTYIDTTEIYNKSLDYNHLGSSISRKEKYPQVLLEKSTKNSVKNSSVSPISCANNSNVNCIDSTLLQKSKKQLDANYCLVKSIIAKTEDVTCKLCKERFGRNLSSFKKHMVQLHGESESSIYVCPICSKKFGFNKHLVQHVKTHLGIKAFRCDKCGTTYGREETLKRHLRTHGLKRPYSCTICPKTFARSEYLMAHLQAHNRTRHVCEKCGVVCSSKFNLYIHFRKHAKEKPFICELCNKSFIRNDFLDNHMEVVHKRNKPKCNVCGKLFSRKDVLKRHMTTHGESTYECKFCLRSFTRKDRLIAHKKTHELNNELKCYKCPAAFHRREVLLKHQKLHENKEQCNVCLKFCISKEKLLAHLKCHENTSNRADGEGGEGDVAAGYTCESCGLTLPRRDQLRQHTRRLHGRPETRGEARKNTKRSDSTTLTVRREKQFTCDICSKAFTRSCNLRAHVLKVHSNKPQDEDEDDPDDIDSLNSALTKSRQNQSNLVDLSSWTSKHEYRTEVSGVLATSSINSGRSLLAVSNNSSVMDSYKENCASWCPRSGSASPAPHLPGNLSLPQLSSQHPHSPINLSAEAITAAAYLLAYPSYLGPYQ